MNELISVIVPIYNGERFIEKCIKNLFEQTYKNIEILLVNDGSTDKSLSLMKKFEKKYKNIRVIDKENGGVSSARNIGIKEANGSYICLLDVDDYYDKKFISEAYKVMKKNNAEVVECKIVEVNEKGKKIREYKMDNCKFFNDDVIKNFLQENSFENYVGNKLFDASLVKKIEFPKYKHSEDFAFLAYLYLNCKTKISINKPMFHYLVRDDSVSHSKFKKKMMDVIYAHEEIYNHLVDNNKNELSKNVSLKLCHNAINLYSLAYFSDEPEKKQLMKYIKNIVKVHLKNAISVTPNITKKLIRTIKYTTFLIIPRLWCNN